MSLGGYIDVGGSGSSASAILAAPNFWTGTFIVRQSGGTPGTDELQISHDGSKAVYHNPETVASGHSFTGAGAAATFDVASSLPGGIRLMTLMLFDNGNQIRLSATTPVNWASVSGLNTAGDVGLLRDAAGVVKSTNGSSGTGWIQNSAAVSRVNGDLTNVTITPANITGLSATLIAGRKYTGEIVLYCSEATAADGLRLDFDGGTATMTSFIAQGMLSDDTSVRMIARVTALATDITETTITGSTIVAIKFAFVVNAAGTFIPRFAKEADAAGATLTLTANSYMWLEDTP